MLDFKGDDFYIKIKINIGPKNEIKEGKSFDAKRLRKI